MEYLGLITLALDLVRRAIQGNYAEDEGDAVYRLIRAAQDAHAARKFGRAD